MRTLQEKIIAELKVKPEIDPQVEINNSIAFICSYLKQFPFLKTLVLGISGGQDSTLTGRICQLAIEKMREATKDTQYSFIAVSLPFGVQSDAADVNDALDFIQPDQFVTVNIQAATEATVTAVQDAGIAVNDFNKGNIKARQRMLTQYAIAGATQGVVVGTDHAAEAITGFYTKYGDGAADIMPIWRLNKRQGRQLLQTMNCPPHLYEKTPTADLEEEKPGLADEEALGVSYTAIDDYLEGKTIATADAEKIEQHYLQSEHKHQLPINYYDTWWKKV